MGALVCVFEREGGGMEGERGRERRREKEREKEREGDREKDGRL